MENNKSKFWELHKKVVAERTTQALEVNISKKGINLITIKDLNSYEEKRIQNTPYLSFPCIWHIVGNEVCPDSPLGNFWIVNTRNGFDKLCEAIIKANKQSESRITILAKKRSKKVTDYEVVEENQVNELKRKYSK